MDDKKKIKTVLTLLFLLLAIGTLGYMILLKIDFVNAMYMTVITISTVGYKEVAIMSQASKIFSIFLIFFGVGTVGYTFTTILVMFIEGTIKDIWRDKKMENRLRTLKDHYILCGADETGLSIVKDCIRHKKTVVVIDNDKKALGHLLIDNDVLTLNADPTDYQTLYKAGVERSKGLFANLKTDMENIMLVLTAREISDDLHIISKSELSGCDMKLKKVGADNIISPNEITGKRMASFMFRPHVLSFLDIITKMDNEPLDLEEIEIGSDSKLLGKSLSQIKIPSRTGLIVIAIKEVERNKMNFNPSGEYIIRKGDILIVLGKEAQIDRLIELVEDGI